MYISIEFCYCWVKDRFIFKFPVEKKSIIVLLQQLMCKNVATSEINYSKTGKKLWVERMKRNRVDLPHGTHIFNLQRYFSISSAQMHSNYVCTCQQLALLPCGVVSCAGEIGSSIRQLASSLSQETLCLFQTHK